MVGPASTATGRQRAKLQLGVYDLSVSNETATALGLTSVQGTMSGEQVTQAIVRHYNTHGGISGRQIRLVEYTADINEPSWQVSLQAACAKFTQDNRVEVVLTTPLQVDDSYESCLAKAGVINIESSQGPDRDSYRRYPLLFTVGQASMNRQIEDRLTILVQRKFLTPKNKIGVIVEGCPYTRRAYETTFAPLAKQLGLTVLRRDVDCTDTLSDAGSYVPQVSSAVLPFRAAGVDRVTFVSGAEGTGLVAFTQQADSQRYYPWYFVDSIAQVANRTGNLPKGQLPQITGVGQIPIRDITSNAPTSAASTRCRSILAGQGLTARTKKDFDLIESSCAQFFLLEEALLRSDGSSERTRLVAALRSVGGSYLSPYTIQGATRYDVHTRDGYPLAAVFAYKTQCACFVYTSKPTRPR